MVPFFVAPQVKISMTDSHANWLPPMNSRSSSLSCASSAKRNARCGTAAIARGDNLVRTTDLIAALKLQAVPSSGFLQQEDLYERAEQHYHALSNETGDSDSSDNDTTGDATDMTSPVAKQTKR